MQVCKSLYPKMKRIAADNPDVVWAKLNGSDPEMVALFQAMGIRKVWMGVGACTHTGNSHKLLSRSAGTRSVHAEGGVGGCWCTHTGNSHKLLSRTAGTRSVHTQQHTQAPMLWHQRPSEHQNVTFLTAPLSDIAPCLMVCLCSGASGMAQCRSVALRHCAWVLVLCVCVCMHASCIRAS